MTGGQRTIVTVVAVAACAVLAWRVGAWREAAVAFDDSAEARQVVDAKAARATALRQMPPVAGYGARPADDVMQLASRTLETAGLPAARLRGVQAEGDRAVGMPGEQETGRRIATARLTLEPLTSQELGAFLSAWRTGQQLWSVARIELSAMPAGGAARSAGQYRAGITVSALYVADDAAASTTPARTGEKP